jgi:hypothetical protein
MDMVQVNAGLLVKVMMGYFLREMGNTLNYIAQQIMGKTGNSLRTLTLLYLQPIQII